MNIEQQEEFQRQQEMQTQAMQNSALNNQQQQQQMFQEEREKGLAEAQLDVEEIIDTIHSLLQGKEYKDDGKGYKEWVEPLDNSMKTLSDWGVHRIMQTIHFHINRNNLLSNFNEEQINRLMLSFTKEMNGLVLLKYEKLFREATFEECKDILDKRLKERAKLKKYAIEIIGKEADEDKINREVVEEVENKIEDEIRSIKQQQLRERLKEYGLLLEEIESQVYATYNRAYRGEERGSLRRHTTFSDIRATGIPQPQQRGGMFSWMRNQ